MIASTKKVVGATAASLLLKFSPALAQDQDNLLDGGALPSVPGKVEDYWLAALQRFDQQTRKLEIYSLLLNALVRDLALPGDKLQAIALDTQRLLAVHNHIQQERDTKRPVLPKPHQKLGPRLESIGKRLGQRTAQGKEKKKIDNPTRLLALKRLVPYSTDFSLSLIEGLENRQELTAYIKLLNSLVSDLAAPKDKAHVIVSKSEALKAMHSKLPADLQEEGLSEELEKMNMDNFDDGKVGPKRNPLILRLLYHLDSMNSRFIQERAKLLKAE